MPSAIGVVGIPTGRMGRAPQPFYDPLAFAIEEAHRRGLELHAGSIRSARCIRRNKSPVALNHISRTPPNCSQIRDKIWARSGEPSVRAYVLRVVMDVVQRYDVDGVQFDDYFYPYPEKDATGRDLEFPMARPGINSGCPMFLSTVTSGGARTSINSSRAFTSPSKH